MSRSCPNRSGRGLRCAYTSGAANGRGFFPCPLTLKVFLWESSSSDAGSNSSSSSSSTSTGIGRLALLEGGVRFAAGTERDEEAPGLAGRWGVGRVTARTAGDARAAVEPEREDEEEAGLYAYFARRAAKAFDAGLGVGSSSLITVRESGAESISSG
jgi:hypothetical protein